MIIKTLVAHKVGIALGASVLGYSTVAAAATGVIPVGVDADSTEIAAAVEEEVAVDDTILDELIVEENPGEPDDSDANETDADETDAGETDESEESDESEVLPPVQDDGTPYGDVACDDAVNHGEYVSSVAKDDDIKDNKGSIVSQAAKTSCGKSDDDRPDDDVDLDDESDDNDRPDDDVDLDDESDDDGNDADLDDASDDEDSDDEESDDEESDKPGNGNGNGDDKSTDKTDDKTDDKPGKGPKNKDD